MNRIVAHLMEFRLFGDEPALILRAQRDLITANLEMLRQAAIPSLILLIPLGLLISFGDALFAHAALSRDQATTLTVKYFPTEGPIPEVLLRAASGVRVETPPVRVPGEREVSWRVRPTRALCAELTVVSARQEIGKKICAGSTLHVLSETRARGPGALLHPFELPFSSSTIKSITLRYPPANVLGFPWLFWFSMASLPGAMLLSLTMRPHRTFSLLAALICIAPMLPAETASPLFARGYTVIPEPQQVKLEGNDFVIDSHWHLDRGSVAENSSAVVSLTEEIGERYGLKLAGDSGGPAISLTMGANAVSPGASQDSDRQAIAEQAYRLDLSPKGIRITANAETGLFYGVQTLVQLIKSHNGSWWLPQSEIVDWPDLGRRHIYWDDAHHLDKLPELKAAIRQASFFKVNGFTIKLEGHFQFRSAPALVEPQALSPAELQELTDYGLRYHVQVIPYLDAPAHIAFILKHPEYAKLRAFPESNYELCATNPDSVRLLKGMFDDLLDATKGSDYFYLSTDEPYYVGFADNAQCDEASKTKELGTRGKLLSQFVNETASYLTSRGRRVIFWGEYPLKPEDIDALPTGIINGETYGEAYDRKYKAHGIRQMIYQSTEGEERLFPQYFLSPAGRRVHRLDENVARVSSAVASVAAEPARKTADLMGITVAGWADMGLHPETFWLGYATITAAGWRPWSAPADEAMTSFYALFYGANTQNVNRLYQLMSIQTQIWTDTWDRTDSHLRTPIWGNSERIFKPAQPAHDQTVPLPAVPDANLQVNRDWSKENAQRLQIVDGSLPESDELLGLLDTNLRLASRHSYNLEVLLSIARLCRQNLDFLRGMAQVDRALGEAANAANNGKPERAVESLDRALTEVRTLRSERNRVYRDTVATWYQSWLPRVAEANGRRFLHQVDDVKDHLPDRTVDMSYLVYRDLNLPLDDWYGQTEAARNRYAKAHGLEEKSVSLSWRALD